jgi:hypothetical protein
MGECGDTLRQVSVRHYVTQVRDERGYSQEELGKRGCLAINAGGVERGERNVALETIVRLAKASQFLRQSYSPISHK